MPPGAPPPPWTADRAGESSQHRWAARCYVNKGVQKGNQVRTYAELNVGREVLDTLVLEQRALDERRGDDTLLAAQATEKRVGELSTSVRHGERSRASTVLRLDDLITTKLDAIRQLLQSILGKARRERVGRLRE